ncbi:hypothetical protein KR038_002507, partial [Drosophila bunnanda]
MLMPPERIEYYNQSLGQRLQRLVTSIRSYQALKAVKTAELPNQASRLWELNQRYRLLKGKNEAASFALLSACQEAYQGLYDSILKLVEELDEVSIQVVEFENECLLLTKEQEASATPACLKELLDFFKEFQESLQNQTKYLELHLRQLHPKFGLGESALEAFQNDLRLPEHVEAHMALGLAKIERLLKNPLDF